jgi:hypothetical protein
MSFDAELHLADALHRVGVEDHAALPAERADLGDGLDRADLVVGEHHRHRMVLSVMALPIVVRVTTALGPTSR